MIVFDTYAWIEYFLGSEKGKKVKEIVDSEEEIITPSLVLSEIKHKYQKEGRDYESRLSFIMDRSLIMSIDERIAMLGGNLKTKFNLYLIDALIYAVSVFLKARLLTGDKHLIGLPGVDRLR